MKKNLDVRKAIEDSNIKYWQVAERLGIQDGNFSRRLRRELPRSEKERIFKAIEEVKTQNNSKEV
ncbi:hypothetical protein [uncultured Tissierella sp.]|uniref:hypothetical protein n=1 Tax=uncultured Tissierella sp. TaxID=448160 RepID=UPI0028051D8E|nr:hypothetical protein [uncultured Tissierella sp.]MDU5081236.1 hypothetical protein [Bacillota bacterium]